MPEAAKNYSITELEMCGLAINIARFAYLLKRVDFDAIVDYLAIMYIMKSKMEPTTNRIKRLLEQNISWSCWQAFIHFCRLHQVWKGTGKKTYMESKMCSEHAQRHAEKCEKWEP